MQAFDAILAGPFQTYLTLAKKIGDDVAKHGVMVEAAFKAQRDFLVVAAKSQKPSDAGIGTIFTNSSFLPSFLCAQIFGK